MHVSVYPPHVNNGIPLCLGRRFQKEPPLIPVALEAYRLHLTFNSGYVARLDESAAQSACREAIREVELGRLRYDAIYVVIKDYEGSFRNSNPNAVCGRLEWYLLCVTPRDTRFARALGTVQGSKNASDTLR